MKTKRGHHVRHSSDLEIVTSGILFTLLKPG
jgi:hypothetical protein